MTPDVARVVEGVNRTVSSYFGDRQRMMVVHDALIRYISTGDPTLISNVIANNTSIRPQYWPRDCDFLSAHDALEEADIRYLRFALALHLDSVPAWIVAQIENERPGARTFQQIVADLTPLGWNDGHLAKLLDWGWGEPPLERGTELTSLGQYLVQLSDSDLAGVLSRINRSYSPLSGICEFVARWEPGKLLPFLETLYDKATIEQLHVGYWIGLLNIDFEMFEPYANRALPYFATASHRFAVLKQLEKTKPAAYRDQTIAVAKESLRDPVASSRYSQVASWLVSTLRGESVDDLIGFMRPGDAEKEHYKQMVIGEIAAELSRDQMRPILLAAIAGGDGKTRHTAVEHFIPWNESTDLEIVESTLERGLQDGDNDVLMKFIATAAGWNLAQLQENYWSLLNHKSKPVREASADRLGALGDQIVGRVGDLLGASKKDTRLIAARILGAIDTEEARDAMKRRLQIEADDAIRDALMKSLGSSGEVDAGELAATIARAAAKLKGFPVTWLAEDNIPPLRNQQGEILSRDAVRFLLFRQSRAKDIAADAEAKPLYATLDRSTSGDFAMAVLNAYLGSGLDAKDRWALAVGGLLGDSRILRLLTKHIAEWAESSRGKLAEYAVQAVALLDSDEALLALDAMAIRYRSRFKNIGKAANDAFAEAARRRGLSVDELGDMVVPWLGFVPGTARTIAFGEQNVAVRIGSDFKVELTDVAKNKKLGALPSAAPAEIKAEIKELAAALKEATKAQTLRMETQLVRQRRWPQNRWQELFLQHPLLIPYATRLIWAAYSEDAPIGTFRALPDLSLTDCADEPFVLDEAGAQATLTIGVVHPLELDAGAIQNWRTHLADYKVEPPFAQLERPVHRVTEEHRHDKFLDRFVKTSLNAMTFKGRAEKRGWVRGSVIDAGGISTYAKSYPGAGIDAFLGLDGMYIGIDMYSSIELERVFFCPSGAVAIGSYSYDEPSDDKDARLIPMGDVPAIAFSETLGDLLAIAAKKEAQES